MFLGVYTQGSKVILELNEIQFLCWAVFTNSVLFGMALNVHSIIQNLFSYAKRSVGQKITEFHILVQSQGFRVPKEQFCFPFKIEPY